MSGFTDIASTEQLLSMDDTRSTFDAEKEVATMKARRADMRRKRWRLSKLMKYRTELVAMRRAGGTYRDLQLWLRVRKRTRVSDTTIQRFLSKLPEMQAPDGAGGSTGATPSEAKTDA